VEHRADRFVADGVGKVVALPDPVSDHLDAGSARSLPQSVKFRDEISVKPRGEVFWVRHPDSGHHAPGKGLGSVPRAVKFGQGEAVYRAELRVKLGHHQAIYGQQPSMAAGVG
jgi:hypothetical protein